MMRMISFPLRPLTALLAMGLLAACAGGEDGPDEERSLLERFSVAQGGPDEFLVIERDPIVIPANIRDLPAPRPGAASRVEPQVSTLVASAFGTPVVERGAASISSGEVALLAAADAQNVPADARALIEAEHGARRARRIEGLFDILIPRSANPYREDQLDPVAEVIRLRRQYPGIVTPAAPLDEAPQ